MKTPANIDAYKEFILNTPTYGNVLNGNSLFETMNKTPLRLPKGNDKIGRKFDIFTETKGIKQWNYWRIYNSGFTRNEIVPELPNMEEIRHFINQIKRIMKRKNGIIWTIDLFHRDCTYERGER